MRMLSDVERGKITLVLTKSVSRFGRNTEEAVTAYRSIVTAGGKSFFEEQGLDSTNPDSEWYVTVYSGLAQQENTEHSKNIKWGIRKRAEDGSSALFNRPCYGYRVNEEGQFEIVPEQAAVVRDIFSLYIRGLSVLKIIKYLEARSIPSPTGKPTWSKHTIETMLENKKYIGTSQIYISFQLCYPNPKTITNRGQHDIVESSGHHIPIITEKIFAAAQKAREARTNIELDEEGKPRRKTKKYSAAKVELELPEQQGK